MRSEVIRLSRLRHVLHAIVHSHSPEYHEAYVHHEGTTYVCTRCAARTRPLA